VLGIVLEYPQAPDSDLLNSRVASRSFAPVKTSVVGVSVIGTGNFARSVLLPALVSESRVSLRGAVAATGLSAHSAADKFKFNFSTTSVSDVLSDRESHAVVIATRHDAHAQLVIAALEAGKAVFVEKPLCLSELELDAIVNTFQRLEAAGNAPLIMVGFNRRFGPGVEFIKAHVAKVQGPISVTYRVNAGKLPHGSWVADAEQGGGRILGEVCHFVDLCAHLAGAPVTHVHAMRASESVDNVMMTLRMANGAVASIAYVADGDPAGPKERIEVFGGGATAVIDDFRRTSVSTSGSRRAIGGRFSGQDKGHRAEILAFVNAVAEGAPSPIPFASAVNSTRATFAVLTSLESGTVVDITDPTGS
jgi:predicted dehydrogenase